MKEVRNANDKAVSPIIATILLIAITVVLAATLVTILGGFTHGVSNTVVTMSATTQETSNSSTSYTVYVNVSASSTNLSTSQVTLFINGANEGSLASYITSHANATTESSTITAGSTFSFSFNSTVTSLELTYKGNTLYQSGTITVS